MPIWSFEHLAHRCAASPGVSAALSVKCTRIRNSIRSGGGAGWGSNDIGLVLAFSGGGTRAAALAYGVLEELRDTTVVLDDRPRRLLDEIDIISSVSGGRFTSAYYSLYGDRFSFVQDYFNLPCSDISDYPVARAVTASSAVPVLFNPVVVENYQDGKTAKPTWLLATEKRAVGDPEMTQVVDGLKSYFKKDSREYAHFVDGGITDNLGLRAIYEIVEISGGSKAFAAKQNHKPVRNLTIISVNASTSPEPEMDSSNKQPSLSETIGAMSEPGT